MATIRLPDTVLPTIRISDRKDESKQVLEFIDSVLAECQYKKTLGQYRYDARLNVASAADILDSPVNLPEETTPIGAPYVRLESVTDNEFE